MESWKIAILGDDVVGKTAFARQFVANISSDTNIEISEEADAFRRMIVVDNQKCHVEVLDMTKHEETAVFHDRWELEGQAFILMYSITSRSSFEQAFIFYTTMRRVFKGNPVYVLVGNKCDKAYERKVRKEEGLGQAHQFGCEFLETSAKTAQNVERAVACLVRKLRENVVAESDASQKKKQKCIVV